MITNKEIVSLLFREVGDPVMSQIAKKLIYRWRDVRSGAQASQAGLKEASKRKGVSRHLKIKLNFRTEKENDQSPWTLFSFYGS